MTHLALMLKVTSFKKASHVSNKQAKDIKFTIITHKAQKSRQSSCFPRKLESMNVVRLNDFKRS